MNCRSLAGEPLPPDAINLTAPTCRHTAVTPRRHHHLDDPFTETTQTPSAHGHIWRLLDGTPAHAPAGELTRNDQGQLACHLCGKWFDHLGAHVRKHGWSAAGYRRAVGLPLTEPLCNTELSSQISDRQAHQWRENSDVRARLAVGQNLARTGILTQLSTAARADRDPAAALQQAQRLRLQQGRATRARRRQEHLAALTADAGAETLAGFLAAAYRNGASMATLRSLTGLPGHRIRDELLTAGITPRATGHNNPDAKRNRARQIDEQVATRVDATAIRPWLHTQRDQGRSVMDLADTTGRSTAWVRSRLSETTADPRPRRP